MDREERNKKFEEYLHATPAERRKFDLSFLNEPSLPEGLNEELKNASEEYCPDDAYPFGPMAINLEVRKAFIAGYKYHEEHTPLPEDSVAFNKGVEEGKRLMMEEAVDLGTVDLYWEADGDRAFPTFDPPVEDLLMPDIISQKFNDGDKVRIIVLKNTEK